MAILETEPDPIIEGDAPSATAHSVLLLGGTTEAFRLAQLFASEPQLDMISSLAGRTSSPRRPAGRLRIGGFGGVDGLAQFIADQKIEAVIDATHPFAATITDHAVDAAKQLGVPYLLLGRSPWVKTEQDHWLEVTDIASAVEQVPRRARVLLAVGRQEAPAFAKRMDCWFLSRKNRTRRYRQVRSFWNARATLPMMNAR